jgi:hypothetical protein
MITFVKWNALFSLSLLLSLVLAAQVPPAAASGSEVELEAELSNSCLTCTAVPKLKGEAKFEEEFGSDGTTIKEAEIEAQVQIPIPTTSLGIIDATTAGTVPVVLELSKTDPNAPYATCTLALKKASSKKAIYRLKVQTKLSGTTHVPGKKQIGSCTSDPIDLNVQAGDTAIITANSLDVLSGVFGGEEEEDDD